MIFLDVRPNGELIKAPCHPYKTTTLAKDVCLLMPIKDPDVFYSVADNIKSMHGNFKIKYMQSIYFPWKKKCKVGPQMITFVDKNTTEKTKEANARGYLKASSLNTRVKNYNTMIDMTAFFDKIKNIKFTRANLFTFWDAFLDTWDLPHKHKYLYFCPEICLVKLNSINTIKPNDIQPDNIYISFLFMLKYFYEKITKMLIDRNIELLFTDHRTTFRFSFKENTLDKDATIKLLFKNFRRMYLGLEIDKNPEDEEDIEDVQPEADTIKELDEKKINKIIASDAKPKETKINVDDQDLVNIATDKVSTTKLESEEIDNLVVTAPEVIEREIEEKNKKNDKSLEQAKQVEKIVEKSTPKPLPLDIRGHKLKTRQSKIEERNLVEVLASIENMAEGIEEKVVDNGTTGNFNQFRIYEYDNQYQKQAKKDRVDIGKSLETNSVPLFMTDYNEKVDDKLADSYVKSVQYTFESPNSTKERHTFTVRVPELREGRYLYVNGSDKAMIRQKVALPIIRLKDRVVFTSYYNKMFIDYGSGNLTKKTAKIKKFIKYIRKHFSFNDLKINFDFAPAFYSNREKNNFSEELLEVTRYVSKITIDKDNFIDFTLGDTLIGKINGMEIYHNSTDNYYYDEELKLEYDILTVFDLILAKLNNYVTEYWTNQIRNKKASDNLINPKAFLLGKKIDLLLILLHNYEENLLEILNILRDQYELQYIITPFVEDKAPKRIYNDDDGDQFLFSNFALDIKYNNLPNRALLDILNSWDLSQYDSLILKDIVEDNIESSNTVLYLANYKDLFIDPITKDVMDEMGLPSTWGEAIIYCNFLLFNYDRTISEVSLKNERMPSNSEVIQGILYKKVADAYGEYSVKKKRGSKNAVFSVERDAVISEIVTLPNVEESNKINPVQNLDKTLTVSNKGHLGINDDRSYTPPKREWDKSFYGIMSDVSPYTKGSGVSKHLAVNPNITEKRGFFNETEIEDVTPDMIMSVSASLGPFAQRHDSTPRLAMGMQQFNHLLGTEGSDVALVSYGMDSSMASLDVDFAHHMPDDGEIIFVNDRYIKVRFTNLTENGKPLEKIYQIDKIERNASKAFYIPNNMELNPDIKIKVGEKLKKDTILMYNKNLYQYHGGDIVFKSGPIVNVAIANSQNSYEDAVLITESLAQKLKTKTVKRISVKLNINNRIIFALRDLGLINPGDPIFKYAEDTGSEFINQNLDLSLLDETLLKVKESHYKGRISDIFIYYKLNDDEKKSMDPSIKKFIKDIENMYEVKYKSSTLRQNLSAVDSNRDVDHVTELKGVKRNKINGDNVDKGVILIEYFLEVDQPFTIGDKITVGNTALKGVCSKIVKDEEAPYGYTTKRKVDLILSPISPLARMVFSTFINGVLSACVVQMNEDLKKIVNKK